MGFNDDRLQNELVDLILRERKVLPLPPPKVRPPHIATLLEMLTYRRPDGSKSEKKFIRRYLVPLGVTQDKYGNIYKRIGDSPILWSSHTDTVHRVGGRQGIRVLGDTVHVADINSNCLGADCTAGVWMMTEMIKADVPGLYIFHKAEEVGGLGSDWLSKNRPEVLKDVKYAVAFDRRGSASIITHQWGGRCCSKAFAESLSTAIGMEHVQDSGGSFTDTANYVDLVGECTNISVGYKDEHSKAETLDLVYIDELRSAMLQADFADLVSERKPGDIDYEDDSWKHSRAYGGSGNYRSYGTYTSGSGWAWPEDQEPSGFRNTNRTLASLVREHPDEVADWLEEYGITAEEIAEAVYMRGGVLRTS